MNPIDKITYCIVNDLQQKRIAENHVPENVSLHDILRVINEQVKKSLNGFIERGTMSWYSNLNGIPMFKIKNPIE